MTNIAQLAITFKVSKLKIEHYRLPENVILSILCTSQLNRPQFSPVTYYYHLSFARFRAPRSHPERHLAKKPKNKLNYSFRL